MTNLIVLVLCFALGIALRRSGRLPNGAHRVLNAFVVNIALPALVLRHVHELRPDPALLFPAAMPWVLFALGVGFFAALGRAAGWPRQTTGGLMLVGGLANTSFVGLPMIETFYGSAFLGVGILVDQLGTYMVLSTAGIAVATLCSASSDGVQPGPILRKILAFPPFQALALGLLLIPLPYPAPRGPTARARLCYPNRPDSEPRPSGARFSRLPAPAGRAAQQRGGAVGRAAVQAGAGACAGDGAVRGRPARRRDGDAGHAVRGCDGPDDRRCDRGHGARAEPAARHPHGGHRHPGVAAHRRRLVAPVGRRLVGRRLVGRRLAHPTQRTDGADGGASA